MNRRFITSFGCFITLLAIGGSAYAEPQWLNSFESRYPSATELSTCGVCHNNFSSNSSRNPYGNAFKNAGGPNNPTAAFNSIANGDADGDGTSNIDEILTDNGFFPGWDCDNYLNAVNEPSDLVDFVDPSKPGCAAPTTTTTTSTTTSTTAAPTTTTSTSTTSSSTSTTTSTSTSTTTTTLPNGAKCAQPVTSGPLPVASDCLYILNTAVGAQTCEPDRCVCDPNGDHNVFASDALFCLTAAVGSPVTLECSCGATTTSSTTSTTLVGG